MSVGIAKHPLLDSLGTKMQPQNTPFGPFC